MSETLEALREPRSLKRNIRVKRVESKCLEDENDDY